MRMESCEGCGNMIDIASDHKPGCTVALDNKLRAAGCDWNDTPGTRTIGHIANCIPCAEEWPQIAMNPTKARAEYQRMLFERIEKEMKELP